MAQRLLILGASARAAAWSARRAGFEPQAVDLFGDEDLRSIADVRVGRKYPDDLEQLALQLAPTPWLFTGGLENCDELVDRVSAYHPLWGNPGHVLRAVRNHERLAEVCRDAGFRVPRIVDDPALVPADGTWLRKARHGSGGCHVSRWHGTSTESAPQGAWYYQEHFEGLAASAIFVAARGDAWLAGITRQRIGLACGGKHEFQYCGSIAPWPVAPATSARMLELGRAISQTFQLVGLFGVDLLLQGDEIIPIEVNPRYTASIEVLERTLGWNSLLDHRNACLEQQLPLESASGHVRPAAGKAILFLRSKLVVPQNLGNQNLAPHDDPNWPTLADIPRAEITIRAGEPLATVFVVSELAEVEVRLQAALAELAAMAYGFRPIGDDAA